MSEEIGGATVTKLNMFQTPVQISPQVGTFLTHPPFLKEILEVNPVKEQKGRLDILVNNAYAGVSLIDKSSGKKFYETDPVEQWDVINGVGLRLINYLLRDKQGF